ncbi:carboxylesterase/lipase family protein [Algoriphagus zhangzhouensis]|uniref:Carboxylic ester hydrolase n=1 Tax=Algoriphagus zhangzhouensis TaxID=1073327 RepID=A0A1M7ZK29_9BACT|nr:carboxylesterase family protein [Algoriphagus zhangzhouensis]TDY43121.1 para-nitrobenzyl esterase [Algoriphagus zhangzhouensis]SHO65238.1 para-nitrobenzyl esterase [Algoriphagus zhangzhouensis]
MKTHLAYFILFFAFACSEKKPDYSINIDDVSVTGGRISGFFSAKDSIKIFKGIPFAAPPLGELRWKAPQPVIPWEGVLETKENPASLMQGAPVPFFAWSEEFLIPKEPISEDGLYLNVWTPAKDESEKLPVMVWVHGGGFSAGSGTVPLYDGEALAKKGIIVVTINYRLGIFGFLAHPELSAENPDGISGNYGILDQIAALKWVNENIAAFGGDPDNVTIAGQSAGAFSINALVVSPLAKGYFNKAIAESGAMVNRGSGLVGGLKSSEERYAQLLSDSGLTSIEKMRKIPADSLMKIQGWFFPVVDGVVIPSVKEAIISKNSSDVPLLTGWNADDNVSLGPPVSMEEFEKNAVKQYGGRAGEFLELFPAKDEVQLAESQGVISELNFGMQNYSWAKLQSLYGSQPAYLYYFTRIPPGEPNYGAFHSAEFSYAFHTLHYWNRSFEKIDYDLEEKMSTYWVNFVKTGDPNGEGMPEWPVFNPEDPLVMELGTEVKSIPLPHSAQIRFLESTIQ